MFVYLLYKYSTEEKVIKGTCWLKLNITSLVDQRNFLGNYTQHLKPCHLTIWLNIIIPSRYWWIYERNKKNHLRLKHDKKNPLIKLMRLDQKHDMCLGSLQFDQTILIPSPLGSSCASATIGFKKDTSTVMVD